jgi:hypothetical protein
MNVILQKKNFFPLTNRAEDPTPLINKVCIFSVTEFDPVSMTPVVSPLRIGLMKENGHI